MQLVLPKSKDPLYTFSKGFHHASSTLHSFQYKKKKKKSDSTLHIVFPNFQCTHTSHNNHQMGSRKDCIEKEAAPFHASRSEQETKIKSKIFTQNSAVRYCGGSLECTIDFQRMARYIYSKQGPIDFSQARLQKRRRRKKIKSARV